MSMALTEDREYKINLDKPRGVRSMSVNNITANVTLGIQLIGISKMSISMFVIWIVDIVFKVYPRVI